MGSSVSAQNLFVSSYTPGVVYEFSPSGDQSTFVSGMDFPTGLAFNSVGDLFVANSADDGPPGNIIEITPGGVQSTFATGVDPKGLAFNSAGDLFVSDYHGDVIYEFTPGGVRSVFASGFGAPAALAFNSAGDLFVADGYGDGNGRITEIAPNGTKTLFASGFNYEPGLAFNSAGDLFVSDQISGNIYEYTPDGTRSIFASGISPGYLAFNSAGDLFDVDSSGNIYEFTPSGVRSTFASGIEQPAGLAFQPLPEAAEDFNAFVDAVSISTNSAGNLVYRSFGNQKLIQGCASKMGIKSLKDLRLVFDLNADALEVVSGYGTKQALVCTPLTFTGGVFLSDKNATRSERQAWVYWDGQTTPSGTLSATESYGYGVSNRLTSFSLSGELQFSLPGNGTNPPTIYQGSVTAGSGLFFPTVPPVVPPPPFMR